MTSIRFMPHTWSLEIIRQLKITSKVGCFVSRMKKTCFDPLYKGCWYIFFLMTIDLTHHVYNIELTKNMFWIIFSFKIVQCSPYLQVTTSTTMVLTKSGSSSHPETWIALPQSILQIMFMVWLPNSFLRGQFTWLFEFPMLPLYRILIDQQRNQSEADLGCRHCYFVKSKLLHCPHRQLIIHLVHCPRCKGKSNGWER